MFSSRTNFNKLFLFHIIKLIKKAVTLRNSLCYSFFCTTIVKVKSFAEDAVKMGIALFKYNDC